MDERQKLLITLLAQWDAPFYPVRDFRTGLSVNAYILRTEYAAAGMPYASGRHGEKERKRGERDLGELIEAGLVGASKAAARISAIRLTEAGETAARELVGMAGLTDAGFKLLADVAARGKMPPKLMTDFWIPEATIRGDASTRALGLLEEDAIALLCRGWLLAAANGCRRVSYAVTAAGLKAIAKQKTKLPTWSGMVNEDARTLYFSTLKSQLARIAAAEPTQS